MKLFLNMVRLAFPELYEAKTMDGEGDPSFSASLILTPQHPDIKALNAVIEAVAKEKWGAKADAILEGILAADKGCLHNGDRKAHLAGFKGNKFVPARSATRPLVIDANKVPLTKKDGKPYSGCYVNGHIDVWAQDNKFGKRINAGLCGIQFVKDGDSFRGSGASSVDEFDNISVGAHAEDLV